MFTIFTQNKDEKAGRTIHAKRAGDVVLMLKRGRIAKTDKIKDPDLGLITVGTFVAEIESAADTCATLELMIEDIKKLTEVYKSCPPTTLIKHE